jgi:Mce-associated membrane protein
LSVHVSEPEAAAADSAARVRRLPAIPRGIAVLAAASAALLVAGIVLLVLAAGLSGSPARQNVALSDQAGTRDVESAVSGDVAALFSYSYANVGSARAEAARVLTGQAAAQYAELAPMLRSAASQQLTVSTKVVQAGVSWLSGGTARVLLFLDQTATRAGAKPVTSAAQLAVTAQQSGGQWRITSIEAR